MPVLALAAFGAGTAACMSGCIVGRVSASKTIRVSNVTPEDVLYVSNAAYAAFRAAPTAGSASRDATSCIASCSSGVIFAYAVFAAVS